MSDTAIRTAYAEDLAEAERRIADYRELAQAAMDLLHVAYLEEKDTYETLERHRAENREQRAEIAQLRAEIARLKADRGQR